MTRKKSGKNNNKNNTAAKTKFFAPINSKHDNVTQKSDISASATSKQEESWFNSLDSESKLILCAGVPFSLATTFLSYAWREYNNYGLPQDVPTKWIGEFLGLCLGAGVFAALAETYQYFKAPAAETQNLPAARR